MQPKSSTPQISRGLIGRVCGCILRERKRILLVALCCILGASWYELFSEKVFPIRGSIQFHPGYLKGKSATAGAAAVDFGAELAKAARSADVLSSAVRQTKEFRFAILGTGDPMAALQGQLWVRVDTSIDQLEVGLDSPFPHQAATVVNAVINSLLTSYQANGGAEKAPIIDPLMVAKVNAATVDVWPKGLSPAIAILISSGVGLILGIVLALYLGISDRRVHSPGQIEEALGLRTAGYLSLLSSKLSPAGRGLATYVDPTSEAAMQCRSLLPRIFGGDVGQKSGLLLIASPSRGEGRSTVALNLAAMLAMADVSVVLVDADIQSPTLHKFLEARDSAQGLCEALENPAAVNEFVRPTHVNHLHLLSCGKPSAAATAKLQGMAMEEVLANLRKKYSYVLLDSGPVLGNPVTLALASRCETTLLVFQAQRTKLADADECRKVLNRHGITQVVALVNAPHRDVRRKYFKNKSQQPTPQDVINESYDDTYNYGWSREENPKINQHISTL
jgi:capsular exopolysaccharide synthesis family protein